MRTAPMPVGIHTMAPPQGLRPLRPTHPDRKAARLGGLVDIAQRLRYFMPFAELSVVLDGCRGEEKDFFRDKLVEMDNLIKAMPKTYEQEGKGDEAIVTLHYFGPSSDFYITEKDAGSEDDEKNGIAAGTQRQAYGRASINGNYPEMGYISIADLIANGVELDLHFTPKPLKEIK